MTPRNLSRALLVPFAAALLLAGCGGDAPPPAVDVTGTWSGTVESNAGPPGFEPVFGSYRMTLALVQSGAAVTGTLASEGAFAGTVAGGVSGSGVTLRVTVAPCGPVGSLPGNVALSGTVAPTPPGTMTISYVGTPCGVEDHGLGVLSRP